ncbi:MAG: insulinase family protein [Armatimonadetes bacterium]|nr:insulinase family protein [Armatimonadota bacterium]
MNSETHHDPEGPVGVPAALLSSDVSRHVLDNGLTVLVKEVYPASVVSLSIYSRVGSVDEPDERAGISHFIEHMLFKGTPRRPVGKIAQEIHSLGGYLNGFTSYDCTCYWIVLPSRCFSTALDIEADAILNPLLNPVEVEKEARVIIEELKMYEDRPEAYCFQKLMRLAYNRHPYGRPIIGYEDVVLRSGVTELEEHYRQYYHPNNMAVVVVGDVRAETAVREVDQVLGHLKPAQVRRREREPEPAQRKERFLQVEGDIATAHMQIGWHIPDVFHDDTFACDILSSILGEGRSSRLYRRLREERAVVTNIGASIFAERDPGLFIVDAALDPARVDDAREGVAAEIARVVKDGVTETEVQKAKNMVEATYVFAQETVEGQGRKIGYYEMLGDYALAERYVQKLYHVTPDDVVRVAEKYLVGRNCSTVAYVPRTEPGRGAGRVGS